jgi:carboxymethylenebutenolidase
MCYPPGARPPEVPAELLVARPEDLPAISGGTAGDDAILTSADGTRFRSYVAKAGKGGDVGVVICPDVRGLHPFYEELAERFVSAGTHALAFDYFGRTAGTERRKGDFDVMAHVRQTAPKTLFADIASGVAYLRRETGAQRVFVLGFCFGGRVAFLSSAEQQGVAGVVGFYGRLSKRDGETWPVPAEEAKHMRAPVLGLMGGADPGIPQSDVDAFDRALGAASVKHHLEVYPGAPHSFFDRTFAENKAACDDAWRRVLAFFRSGDPAARA